MKNIPNSIDDYIATFPVETQSALQEIRATIKALVPNAEEHISYNMPAFKVNGDFFIHFSAWKKHIGMYPIPAGNEAFQKSVLKYKGAKSSLKFPLDEPLPLKLIERVVKLHVDANKKKTKGETK